jgi:hypothetical protein
MYIQLGDEGQIGSDNMEITVEEAPAEEDNSGSDDLFDIDDLDRLGST